MLSTLRTLLLRQRPFRYVGTRMPCNLCSGTDFVVIARRDRWLNPLTNSICRRCGLVCLDPMPTEAEVADFYSRKYRRHYDGAAEPTAKHLLRSRRSAELRFRILEPHLKPGMRILDVGSGSGEFLARLKEAGYEAEGVEPDESFARYAERSYGMKVHAAPLAEVDFGRRKFDLVTSWHSLEHMRDPHQALTRMHELLAADGLAHLVVPDLAEPHKTPMANFRFAHLHGFTRETFAMLAAKAGFASLDDPQWGTGPLFRRLAGPDPGWFRYPAHAERLEAYLHDRTLWRMLLSGETWRRFVRRVRYLVGDRLTLWRAARGRSH